MSVASQDIVENTVPSLSTMTDTHQNLAVAEPQDIYQNTVSSMSTMTDTHQDLAVAMPVVEEQDVDRIAIAQEIDIKKKIPFFKKKRFVIIVVGSFIVLAAIAVCISLIVTILIPGVGPGEIDKDEERPFKKRIKKFNETSTVDLYDYFDEYEDVIELLSNGSIAFEPSEDWHPEFTAAVWMMFVDSLNVSSEYETFDQRHTLATLYFGTNGTNWFIDITSPFLTDFNDTSLIDNSTLIDSTIYEALSVEFLGTGSECTWPGITCNEFDEVETIELPYVQMGGIIPEKITSLGSVTNIFLEGNYLSTTIPTYLGELSNLQELSLSYNWYTGTIPTELYNLVSLNALAVHYNFLTGPISNDIINMKSCKGIYAHRNYLTGPLPKDIGKLPFITSMMLSSNFFSGTLPESWYDLVRLEQMFIDSNDISGTISPKIGNMESLILMDFDENSLNGTIPEEVYELTELQEFRFSNSMLSGTLSDKIENWSNMYIMDLTNNNLEGTIPNGIGELTNMMALLLRFNDFEGTIPSGIGNMKGLRYFWFHHNPKLDGTIPRSVCDLTLLNLEELGADCLTTFRDTPVYHCDCCQLCCDPFNDECTYV